MPRDAHLCPLFKDAQGKFAFAERTFVYDAQLFEMTDRKILCFKITTISKLQIFVKFLNIFKEKSGQKGLYLLE